MSSAPAQVSTLPQWTEADVDVAVIGAGAAGLAVARHLALTQVGLQVLVLEAAERRGGRAWTVKPKLLGGQPVDLGCGWLHGARTNDWTHIAAELGFTIDTTPAPWDEGGRDMGLTANEQRAAESDVEAYFRRLQQQGGRTEDGTLDALLEPGGRWNALLESMGTFIYGAALSEVSILDSHRYDPGPGPDWRVREGYGALVSRFGTPVPVALETTVRHIDHADASTIRLATNRGVLRARFVVVTASTNMLATEDIRFTPALPDKLHAAASLPLGLANKFYFSVASPDELPVDGHFLGSPFRNDTGAYHVRPFGRPVIEAYFAGPLARELERASHAAAQAFAQDELADRFGNSIRHRLQIAAGSAWGDVPHVGGSYSYAKPGAAGERAVLAAPVNDRLFFAGEACSAARFSTAHGAYENGIAVAEQISRLAK